MKRFTITDGLLRKVEKKLFQVAKKEYQADGLYVCLDGIEINAGGENDYSIEYKVRWGKMVDGKCVFQFEATIWAGDGNLNFLTGQFYEQILRADGNK